MKENKRQKSNKKDTEIENEKKIVRNANGKRKTVRNKKINV